jgi:hypothetical protein
MPLSRYGFKGIIPVYTCVAPLLNSIACGNGPARRIMTAGGGFCHVKRKHQYI